MTGKSKNGAGQVLNAETYQALNNISLALLNNGAYYLWVKERYGDEAPFGRILALDSLTILKDFTDAITEAFGMPDIPATYPDLEERTHPELAQAEQELQEIQRQTAAEESQQDWEAEAEAAPVAVPADLEQKPMDEDSQD